MALRGNTETSISRFFYAMDTQNYELLKKLIAPQADMIHIGTDKDEIWKGWSQLDKATKEQFNNLKYYKANIYDLPIHIADSGNVAWYFHLLDAKIKSTGEEHNWKGARFTGILERMEENWKLVQTHVSIPPLSLIENPKAYLYNRLRK